jgi:hypothetical protein
MALIGTARVYAGFAARAHEGDGSLVSGRRPLHQIRGILAFSTTVEHLAISLSTRAFISGGVLPRTSPPTTTSSRLPVDGSCCATPFWMNEWLSATAARSWRAAPRTDARTSSRARSQQSARMRHRRQRAEWQPHCGAGRALPEGADGGPRASGASSNSNNMVDYNKYRRLRVARSPGKK